MYIDGKTTKRKVSVIIVTYNCVQYIDECLTTVIENSPYEIVVVDNSSNDGTIEIIEQHFPEIVLIKNHENMGFGKAVNLGVDACTGEIAVVLNPDTKVKNDWLHHLVCVLTTNEKVIAVPKIMLYDGSCINTCGNIAHFTGLTFTNCLGKLVDEIPSTLNITGVSGACFAILKDDFLSLGGFDEEIFLYMEDAEFSWRAHAYEFSFQYIPESVVYHNYHLNVNAEKLFRLENGRYYMLRKFLTTKDLVSIGPSLLMTEILSWGYAIRLGSSGITFKFKSMRHLFSKPHVVQQTAYKKFINELEIEMPMDQLSYGHIDLFVKKWANLIYLVNHRILLK